MDNKQSIGNVHPLLKLLYMEYKKMDLFSSCGGYYWNLSEKCPFSLYYNSLDNVVICNFLLRYLDVISMIPLVVLSWNSGLYFDHSYVLEHGWVAI